MKAYLANGLFSEADRIYNVAIAAHLRLAIPKLDLYMPQENEAINNKMAFASSQMIADGDDAKLLQSDFLIAVIDGSEIDAGVACEIGKFSMLNKPIFAIYTDVRQQGAKNPLKFQALLNDPTENQFMYRNLYVVGTIKNSGGKIVGSLDMLIDAILESL